MLIGRYWRTIKYLKLIQIFGRIWHWLYSTKFIKNSKLNLRISSGKWVSSAKRRQLVFGHGEFKFLNEKGNLEINGWDDPKKTKLWKYNLHYFDYLNDINSDNRISWHLYLIRNWIENNSNFKGTGWEPYPTSLRIVNWIKWSFMSNTLDECVLHNLSLQIRWLKKNLEWHILGNHLFSNAKALIFAGLFYEGSEANSWFVKGKTIILKQIKEQILPDGGHFELSPMYHALILEDMLDLINILEKYGHFKFSNQLRKYTPKMLCWLDCMSHPDENLAFFNDTAFGLLQIILK